MSGSILIVDDEPVNQMLLADSLALSGYTPITADDGEQALAILASEEHHIEAILLDRMMPGIDGLSVLKQIRQHPAWQRIPVILQTAVNTHEDIAAGLAAGAYYYLAKPFEMAHAVILVNSAVQDYRRWCDTQAQLNHGIPFAASTEVVSFFANTLIQVQQLAATLAKLTPEPDKTVLGFSELLLNAHEHGNLTIGYQEKSQLQANGTWLEEIQRREQDAQFMQKQIQVHVTRTRHRMTFIIEDEGNGFAWEDYLELSPERAFDSHGRGIALARMLSFDGLEYRGNGNTVAVWLQLPPDFPPSAIPLSALVEKVTAAEMP